jgi:signal peptidase II
MSPKLRVLASVSLSALLLDQLSKVWVVHTLAYRGPSLDERARAGLASLGHVATHPTETVVIPGWLSFIHAQNPAAAMGLMLGVEHRQAAFAAFTLAGVALLTWMYRALAPNERLQAASIGLLLAGAIGNAIDRLHKGTVTDFISFTAAAEPLRSWMIKAIDTPTWYTFNIADSCICVGVALYAIALIVTKDSLEDTSEGSRPDLSEASSVP